MADGTVPHFQMLRAREAVSRGLSQIERQVVAAENAVRGEPAFGLAFDLSRTLIESTCRTILTERQVEWNRDEDLPALIRKVRRNLPFLPPSSSNETTARGSLEQALSGLQSAVQGICELRNHYSFASHGYETDRDRMEQAQATLVAGAADVIIGFLYEMHAQSRANNDGTAQSLYDENQDFNNSIDDSHEICVILEAEFWPSAVLFQMEPETYRLRLAEFKIEIEGSEAVDS
jgi:hypothetical protein